MTTQATTTQPETCTTECQPEAAPAQVDSTPYVYDSSVAICTLADDALNAQLMEKPIIQDNGIMVASLRTENLGIEQIIEFCLSQPNLRFIILCGTDARQTIGHLPGQSFMALQENGTDNNGRIIGATGKRPVIKNLTKEAIEHFRKTVTLINLVDDSDCAKAITVIERCLADNPGPAERIHKNIPIKTTVPCHQAIEPNGMLSDPAGYLVIEVLTEKCALGLTHYHNTGEITGVVEGVSHKAIYFKAIELGWVSLLDHAAYLGRELYRAEQTLNNGTEYIQDFLFKSE